MVVSCKMRQMVCRIELFEKICIIKARHYTMFPSHRLTRNYFQSRAVHSSLKNSIATRIESVRPCYTYYEQNFLILSKQVWYFGFQNCSYLLAQLLSFFDRRFLTDYFLFLEIITSKQIVKASLFFFQLRISSERKQNF